MGTVSARNWSRQAWALADSQHGVVAHWQLRQLGLSGEAIRHRLASGRLHRLMRGVYAVGRPEVTDRGRWMAAVLACGPHALLSHRSAAALLGIRKPWNGPIEVVVPGDIRRRRACIRTYRRTSWTAGAGGVAGAAPGDGGASSGSGSDRAGVDGVPWPLLPSFVGPIPVTGPIVTLVDLATCLPVGQLEAAVNEADHRDLVNPEVLRTALDLLPRRAGLCRLRDLLDAATTALTATELERLFLPLARQVGLPVPETQAEPGSHRVDFYWAELELIVETDSLRYHRTPFKQAADKRRDNAHAASGLTTLRFTHGQVTSEPDYVRAELRTTVRRMAARRADAMADRAASGARPGPPTN